MHHQFSSSNSSNDTPNQYAHNSNEAINSSNSRVGLTNTVSSSTSSGPLVPYRPQNQSSLYADPLGNVTIPTVEHSRISSFPEPKRPCLVDSKDGRINPGHLDVQFTNCSSSRCLMERSRLQAELKKLSLEYKQAKRALFEKDMNLGLEQDKRKRLKADFNHQISSLRNKLYEYENESINLMTDNNALKCQLTQIHAELVGIQEKANKLCEDSSSYLLNDYNLNGSATVVVGGNAGNLLSEIHWKLDEAIQRKQIFIASGYETLPEAYNPPEFLEESGLNESQSQWNSTFLNDELPVITSCASIQHDEQRSCSSLVGNRDGMEVPEERDPYGNDVNARARQLEIVIPNANALHNENQDNNIIDDSDDDVVFICEVPRTENSTIIGVQQCTPNTSSLNSRDCGNDHTPVVGSLLRQLNSASVTTEQFQGTCSGTITESGMSSINQNFSRPQNQFENDFNINMASSGSQLSAHAKMRDESLLLCPINGPRGNVPAAAIPTAPSEAARSVAHTPKSTSSSIATPSQEFVIKDADNSGDRSTNHIGSNKKDDVSERRRMPKKEEDVTETVTFKCIIKKFHKYDKSKSGDLFWCTCGSKYSAKPSLKKHMNQQNQIFICLNCNKEFPTLDKVTQHACRHDTGDAKPQ